LKELGYEYGIIVTASHNPKEYVGFKVCKKGAIPVSPKEELLDKFELESYDGDLSRNDKELINNILRNDVYNDLKKYLMQYYQNVNHDLNISVDFGSGSATYFEKEFFKNNFHNLSFVNKIPNGNFPSHDPDTLKPEVRKDIIELVKEKESDVGIIFDGDADRIGIIDEKGRNIPGDILTIIIGKQIEKNIYNTKIGYDVRSSKAVKEEFKNSKEVKIGHYFIKKMMRNEDIDFAGELSNHFYFKTVGFFEMPLLAFYYILKAIEEKPLSEWYNQYNKYYKSDEINFEGGKKVLDAIKEEYGSDSEIDGITKRHNDWWFNIRKSNTEDVLRLNLEADKKGLLNKKTNELSEFIKKV
ncbi:MAG: phosphomannomutase/phosphoglucomutase, partial [Candidatus Woesearchaeota archaeon]